MNRTTAFLLAIAVLIAHVLVIHHDAAGQIAGPYDVAHADYHLSSQLLESGAATWQENEGPYAGHPRPLWWLLLAVLQLLGLALMPNSQLLGLVATLATVIVATRFARDRIAGIVSPMLLVFSGGVAGAAASGTDAPLVALLGASCLVAFHSGSTRGFSALLTLLVAARPEAVFLALGFFLLSLWRRRSGAPLVPLKAFLAPLLAGLVLGLLPSPSRSLYGRWLVWLVTPDQARLDAGLTYLREFVLTSVTPLLLVFPVIEMVTGRLGGVGRHALGLSLVWLLLVVLQGAGVSTFSLDFVPALPLVFLAIQQGMILALDTEKRVLIILSVGGLSLALGGSALASKFPGNLGPVPFMEAHRAWMQSDLPAAQGLRPVLGRMAAEEEVRITSELRTLANFLDRNAEPGSRLLSPWPGALADQTDLVCDDLSGRFRDQETPMGVLELLRREPAFLLPGRLYSGLVNSPDLDMRVARALSLYDQEPYSRIGPELLEVLANYQVVALPISSTPRKLRRPYFLLARRGLGFEPRLELRAMPGVAGGYEVLLVEPFELRMPLLANLQLVVAEASSGESFSLDPLGRAQPGEQHSLRTGLLIKPQDRGPVTLWTGQLPEGDWTDPRARLASPGLVGDRPLYRLGEEARP